jgi:hypothetical protein
LLICLFIETKDHPNKTKVISLIGIWYSERNEANVVAVPKPVILAIDVRIHNPNEDEQLIHPVERIASNGEIDK